MYQPSLDIANPTSRFVSNKEDASLNYFLGEHNRSRIHNMIIKAVYEKTEGKASIGRQSDDELQVVMISVIQSNYQEHLPINELNKIVVQRCTKNIIQNLAHYTKYLSDLNSSGPIGTSQDSFQLLVPSSTRASRERSSKVIF
tara:strand:- start:200 stop:628 length:429 start_codon:yes stop_codon:yes gene_type:complete